MEQLRLDHGAFTALMAVPPDHTLIRVLSKLLQIHDDAEERPGGIYDLCEKLTHHRTDELIEILEETTDVPVRPLKPSDYVLQATKRALEEQDMIMMSWQNRSSASSLKNMLFDRQRIIMESR